MPSTSVQLGVAIARLREERELTIETLAAAAGIHFTYLSQIENGRGNPSWKVVGNLAKELGVEIADLDQLARGTSPEASSPPPSVSGGSSATDASTLK